MMSSNIEDFGPHLVLSYSLQIAAFIFSEQLKSSRKSEFKERLNNNNICELVFENKCYYAVLIKGKQLLLFCIRALR